jgi:hypothetical protein
MKNACVSLNWATMYDTEKVNEALRDLRECTSHCIKCPDDELLKEHAKHRAALEQERKEEEDNWTFVRDND